MAIVTKEDLLKRINATIPEGSEDLSLLEDIADTFDDLAAKTQTDWKAKYDSVYAAYRTRFIQGEPAGKPGPAPDPEPEESKGPVKFEDLFESEEIKV